MKQQVKSTPYFSAYSLKSMELASPNESATNFSTYISRVVKRFRLLPATGHKEKKTSINRINIPLAVQSGENNWFNHYE